MLFCVSGAAALDDLKLFAAYRGENTAFKSRHFILMPKAPYNKTADGKFNNCGQYKFHKKSSEHLFFFYYSQKFLFVKPLLYFYFSILKVQKNGLCMAEPRPKSRRMFAASPSYGIDGRHMEEKGYLMERRPPHRRKDCRTDEGRRNG